MKTQPCKDITKCQYADKYKKEGKAFCLICGNDLNPSNEKKAEAEGTGTIFKHASEDL